VAFRGYWGVGDGAYALYVVGTNGCTPRRLTRDIAGDPSWSPDGKWIVFDTSGGGQLWKVRSDGTGLTRLGGGRFHQEVSPSWSSRGNEIAFVRLVIGHGGQIWLMKANGNRPVLLRAAARVSYEEPSWSKDGKRVAFVARPVGRGGVLGTRSWIEVINADGSHVRVLTSKKGSAWNPVWLPDDAGIAWLAGDGYTGTGSVFAARPNGTHVRRVLRAQAEQFAWSSVVLPQRGCH
jgi:Tol biopolymer transport system component